MTNSSIIDQLKNIYKKESTSFKTYLLVILPTLLAWSANFEAVQENGDKALCLGQVKDAEELYINFLKNAPQNEISYAKARLASVYYKDQEHEKAFKTFLEALALLDKKETAPLSNEENKVYQAALKVYLDKAGLTPHETAEKILNDFGSVYDQNRSYHHLGYFIALSYANLGQYDRFFEEFYKSYVEDPQHFLAFKAKAALHIKLFERAKVDSEREEQRQWIVKYAEQAVALQPQDSSLYRMILGFTPDSSKGVVLRAYLNKIIDQNIVIARIDIPYYVEIAIAFQDYDLGQAFLNKAKEWYAYSRVIDVAQQHLDEKRGS